MPGVLCSTLDASCAVPAGGDVLSMDGGRWCVVDE